MHRFVAALAAVSLVACGGPASARLRPTSRPVVPTVAWRWRPPPIAEVGMPAADRRGSAAVVGVSLLVALDPAGREQWRAERLGLRDVAPLLAGDRVLAATEEGVAAFDRASGRLLWDSELGDWGSSPVPAAGLAVVALWEGGLAAVRPDDGSVVWEMKLPGLVMGPPATDGTVAVASWEEEHGDAAGVIAVGVGDGEERWRAELPPGGVSAPAVAGDTVIAVAGDLAAHGLDLATGHYRWRTDVASAGSPEVPPLPLPGAGEVLAVTRLGGLHLLDAAGGRERWAAERDGIAVRGGPVASGAADHPHFALPVDAGRLLLAGPGRGRRVLDPAGRVSGVALAPGGRLLVATRDADQNELVAYDGW